MIGFTGCPGGGPAGGARFGGGPSGGGGIVGGGPGGGAGGVSMDYCEMGYNGEASRLLLFSGCEADGRAAN